MFERYTERARRVLFFARYEATQLGSPAISTDHLLLGLIREGKGLISRLLAGSRLSMEQLRKEIENRTRFREKVSTSVEIPFSDDTKRVLHFAADEADRLRHNDIGTEHLLLGILREESSPAATMLRAAGLELQRVRAQVAAAGDVHDPKRAAPRSAGVHISRNPKPPKPESAAGRSSVSWTITGVGLRALLAEAYGVGRARIDLPTSLDDQALYDAALVLEKPEDADVMTRRMREGIDRHFAITVNRRTQPASVLVMSTPEGAIRAERTSPASNGGLMAISGAVSTDGSGSDDAVHIRVRRLLQELAGGDVRGSTPLGGISGSMSMSMLCDTLEDWLGQPVIDETHLTGTFRIDVRARVDTDGGFIDALRDQVGLLLTAETREVERLVVRARAQPSL